MSKQIDNPDIDKLLFIVGDDNTIIGFGSCGNDSVKRDARLSFRFALCHKSRPDQARFLIEG